MAAERNHPPENFLDSESVIAHQQWIERIGPALFSSAATLAVQRYDPGVILPAPEDVSLERAVEKRRREFSGGRLAAKFALEKLGVMNATIPIGKDRSPLWPDGMVGSITHTAGLAVAVTARRAEVLALGIDLELAEAVQPELWPGILTAREIKRLEATPAAGRNRVATLLFSAKESFYKMQYPLTRQWVDFQEAEVALNEGRGEFELICLQPEAVSELRASAFSGRYATGSDLTITALHLLSTNGQG